MPITQLAFIMLAVESVLGILMKRNGLLHALGAINTLRLQRVKNGDIETGLGLIG